MTTVWVATDDYGTQGIFDSIETLKAAYAGIPGITWKREDVGWYAAAIGTIALEHTVHTARTLDAIR